MIYDTNKYENINNFIFLRSVRDEKSREQPGIY